MDPPTEKAGADTVPFAVLTNAPLIVVILPLDAVRPPAIDCPLPDVDMMKLAAPPASGIVYVREATGAGLVIVVVKVVPNTI